MQQIRQYSTHTLTNVRIGIDLLISRAGLPISNVGNETTVLSVLGIIWWQGLVGWLTGCRRGRCGRGRIGVIPASTVLATGSAVRVGSTAVSPLRTTKPIYIRRNEKTKCVERKITHLPFTLIVTTYLSMDYLLRRLQCLRRNFQDLKLLLSW